MAQHTGRPDDFKVRTTGQCAEGWSGGGDSGLSGRIGPLREVAFEVSPVR
jgi:hypothetical protein